MPSWLYLSLLANLRLHVQIQYVTHVKKIGQFFFRGNFFESPLSLSSCRAAVTAVTIAGHNVTNRRMHIPATETRQAARSRALLRRGRYMAWRSCRSNVAATTVHHTQTHTHTTPSWSLECFWGHRFIKSCTCLQRGPVAFKTQHPSLRYSQY